MIDFLDRLKQKFAPLEEDDVTNKKYVDDAVAGNAHAASLATPATETEAGKPGSVVYAPDSAAATVRDQAVTPAGLAAAMAGGSGGGWSAYLEITVSGSGTLANKAGLAQVIVIGGGGGGASSSADASGGGGGSGAAITYFVNLPANCAYSAIVGAGGALEKGGGGSQITFQESVTCTAGGGGAGGRYYANYGGGGGGGGGGLSGKGADLPSASPYTGGSGGGEGAGHGGGIGHHLYGGAGVSGGGGRYGGNGGTGGSQSTKRGHGGGGMYGAGAGGEADTLAASGTGDAKGCPGKIIIIHL